MAHLVENFKRRPCLVYLHRYPPETEAFQWPAFLGLVDELEEDYDLVYVCMGPAKGKRNEALRKKLRVIELPFTVDQTSGFDKWFKTGLWYLNLGKLKKIVRALIPALVICQEPMPLIPGFFAKLGFNTMIYTSDWWWSILFGHSGWGRRLANQMELREVRSWNRPRVRIIVSTQEEQRLLIAKGAPESRLSVVNAPQNSEIFHPIVPSPKKSELELSEHLHYFAIFGIIRQGKGYDQLLDWWQMAVSEHSDWRLVIIGGAGGEKWCRRQIAKRGLQSVVHMTGWLPTKQDVNRWLNAMDGIIVQRRNSSDNWGIIPSALFNGLSTGRPVVAAGLPGISEVIRDGVDGFLFEPDNRDSFLHAVEQVVADPGLASQVGHMGMARAAECFNTRNTVKAYREIIDTMICSGQPIE